MSATLVLTETEDGGTNAGWKPDPRDGLIALPTRPDLARVWNDTNSEESVPRLDIAGATLAALLDHVHHLSSIVEMLRAEVARLNESATR